MMNEVWDDEEEIEDYESEEDRDERSNYFMDEEVEYD